MSDFIGSLAKGFVRSAVNQVGRDAGRVVSNGVYGNRHSIPVRNVSGNERVIERSEWRVEGTQAIEPSVNKAYFKAFLGFLLNIFGAVILIIAGYKRLKNKNTVKAWRTFSQSVYVADGRCRDGKRYDGDELIRRKVIVEATDEEVKLNEKIAKIYLIAGCVIIALQIIAWITYNGNV